MALEEGKPVGGEMRMSDPPTWPAAVVESRGLNREAGEEREFISRHRNFTASWCRGIVAL
jgi:hypothetical protein